MNEDSWASTAGVGDKRTHPQYVTWDASGEILQYLTFALFYIVKVRRNNETFGGRASLDGLGEIAANIRPVLLKPCLHDTTCCQTGCQTGLTTG